MKVKTPAPQWMTREVTCSCLAVLEVEFGDLSRKHHDADPRDQREQAWDEIFVTCPECGARLLFKDVPMHLLQRIRMAP